MAPSLIDKNVEENDMSFLCQVFMLLHAPCVTYVSSIRRKKQGCPHQIIKVKFYLCLLKMISGQLTYHSYAGPAGFLPASAVPSQALEMPKERYDN